MDLSTAENLAVTDHLLTTTRSVRKRLDFERPVDLAVIRECLEIAIQAPSGSNRQGWHFVVVADAEKRKQIGALYQQSFDIYRPPASRTAPAEPPADPQAAQLARVIDSATYLSQHMHRAPVLVIPCIEGRLEDPSPGTQAGFYGSILPAAWSLMLALRARGLGTAWTTLHLRYEQEVAQILGIPDNIIQAALLPVAYFKGSDFKRAKRIPAEEVTHWDGWA